MKASMGYLRSTKTGREFLIAREDAAGDWHVAHDLAVGEVCDVMQAVAWSEAQASEPIYVDLTVGGQRLRVTDLRARGGARAPIGSRDAYEIDIDQESGEHVALIITAAEHFARKPARQPA